MGIEGICCRILYSFILVVGELQFKLVKLGNYRTVRLCVFHGVIFKIDSHFLVTDFFIHYILGGSGIIRNVLLVYKFAEYVVDVYS